MSNYAFFSKDQGHWGESYQSLWGCHNIYPLLEQFHVAHITKMQLASIPCLKAWGNVEKFHSDVAFLLVLPKEGVVEERIYGHAMVWVHPYQARVSTIEETIKLLTQPAPSGPDWPYALVQLNGDACHVPLPTEGNLSVMMERSTSNLP